MIKKPASYIDNEMSNLMSTEQDHPKTEDDIAQGKLGGVKGSPDLPSAPMTPQQEKNTPKPLDPGHTA